MPAPRCYFHSVPQYRWCSPKQLMLIALTSKYKWRDIILGTAAAILVLNGLAVLAGGLVSEFIPDWLIKMIAALAFLYFAVSTIASEEDEEEEEGGI